MTGRVVAVAHTGLTVSDMARALRFFGDGLGATVTEPVFHDDPMFERITGVERAAIEIAYVDLPGHRLELLSYRSPDTRRPSTARPCDPGHLHLALRVAGIDDIAARMAAHGFVPAGPVEHVPAAGFSVVYTYGFDNLVIELMDHGDPS